MVAEDSERVRARGEGPGWEGHANGDGWDGVQGVDVGVGEGRGVEEGCDCAGGGGVCACGSAGVVLDAAADCYVLEGERGSGEVGSVCGFRLDGSGDIGIEETYHHWLGLLELGQMAW